MGRFFFFFWEHTGVSAPQRAGTLERVVKYDQEAFAKAWDYLPSSSSDGEDEQRFFFKTFFLPTLFSPWKRGMTAILGPTASFFRPFAHAG